jgi:biofilm PGA synthesis lipoprotein PgaB
MNSFFFKYVSALMLLAQVSFVQAAAVLQYHHISSTTPPSTSITPELFAQHLNYLAENNFQIVPLTELVTLLQQGKPLPDKTLAITFDDAYASVYSTAYPLLKQRGWPFTVFVNPQPIEQNKSLFVTWTQLQEMAKQGATIANHTTEHNHLLRVRQGETRAQWRERICKEITDAENKITQMTGQSHQILAYPYGEYDAPTKALVKDLGYVAFGQQSGPLRLGDDLQALPRFSFGGSYGELEDFTTKINSRPFPVVAINFYRDATLKQSTDVVLMPGQKPVIALLLANKKLSSRVQCFASGQGAIAVNLVDEQLLIQANEPLRPGRTRYNCTAPTGERGRFYWLSQQWVTAGENGKWLHED